MNHITDINRLKGTALESHILVLRLMADDAIDEATAVDAQGGDVSALVAEAEQLTRLADIGSRRMRAA